ncbi:hypothetical protein [Mongoliimonas terrestris]|uniref:hypothetical protein n=1 Tax=Mongoliimonas terrestris TaxID=1709001 RepID=UPI00094997DE|nr:hypothetical protein [Mongoliimonas terrestris]
MPDSMPPSARRFLCIVEPGADLGAVAGRIAAQGLVVEETLDLLGTLVVSGDGADRRLRAMPEVLSVEEERTAFTQGGGR